jgi:hypothetical protein
LFTRIAGPFILMPVLLCGALIAMTTSSKLQRHRWLVVVWAAAAFLIPIGLEMAGLLSPSWGVQLDSIDAYSRIFRMGGGTGSFALIGANILFVSIVGLVSVRVHSAAKDAKRAVFIQAWHLHHLLPSAR